MMNKIKYLILFFVLSICINSYCNDIWVNASDGNLYCFNEQKDDFYKGWNWLIDSNTLSIKLQLFSDKGVYLGDFTPNGKSIQEKAANLALKLYKSKLVSYDQNKRNSTLIFDCSSFVGRLYKLCGLDFYNNYTTTSQQLYHFMKSNDYWLIDYEKAKEGDLVYYGNTEETVNHCGIIVRDDVDNKLKVLSCSKESNTIIKNLLIRKDIYCIIRPMKEVINDF